MFDDKVKNKSDSDVSVDCQGCFYFVFLLFLFCRSHVLDETAEYYEVSFVSWYLTFDLKTSVNHSTTKLMEDADSMKTNTAIISVEEF